MESTEFAHATVRGNGGHVMPVAHGGDENLIVRFYMESVKQGAESEKEGRPIFRDIPYVRINFPGDRTREVVRKASDQDKERFPRQWDRFLKQQEEVHEGTPIEQWGPISRSTALSYKGVNVHTVEQLAAVSDSALHNLGHGARDMRDKARSWLKTTKDSAEALRLVSENQHLRDEMESLKAQVAELASKKRSKKDED